MRHRKVMVTGGSGRLGRFVVDTLLERCDVSVLDIGPPSADVPYHEASILDADAVLRAFEGHDAVIHLAGIDEGNDFPDHTYFETNVQGTWNVLHAARLRGIERVVVASSSASYGLTRSRGPDFLPVDETHPQRPVETYHLTKHVIETTCRGFARGGLRTVCLRPTLVVRPEVEARYLAQLELDDPDAAPPPDAVGSNGERPYGALSATRTYVRSRDCARCFRLALDYDGAAFDVFNVSANDGIGHERTLERLERVLGQLPEIRDAARFRDDPHASVLDNRRARELLGWEPEGDWRDVTG